MQHFEETIVINRPLEAVFALAMDFANHAHWTPGLLEARLTSPGPAGAGSTYVYNMAMMGRKMETSGEISAFNAPTLYQWKSTSGPFPMSGGMRFEATEGGTRVTQFTDAEPGGFFKLAAPLLMSSMKKQGVESLQKMKAWMESR